MSIKLGVIVPSNSPTNFLTIFGPSLAWLRCGLEDVEVKILLTAQRPWTIEGLEIAKDQCDQAGMELLVANAEAESPPRMCYLRQKAAALWCEADVYMNADDNMQFYSARIDPELNHAKTSGQKYAEVLDYMSAYRRCGLVQCHTTDAAGWGESIRPTRNGLITTAKGLFFRNIFQGILWPTFTFRFKASLEETVAAYRILEYGYFPARQYQNPTIHPIHKIGSDNSLHSRELIDANAGDWIRTHFQDPYWTHESCRFPDMLIRKATYLGGMMVSFSSEDPIFKMEPLRR